MTLLKRCTCLMIALITVFCGFSFISIDTEAAEADGVSFANATETLRTENALSDYPLTLEAVLSLPTSYSSRAGAVVSNYINDQSAGYGFEIHEKGVPRMYIVDNKKPTSGTGSNMAIYDFKFTGVDVRSDSSFVHVAVTFTKEASALVGKCYLNGTLKQTMSIAYKASEGPVYLSQFSTGVGGDNRSGNAQYFKGKISKAALYSDVRSDSEIASDSVNMDFADAACIAGYNLTVDDELPYFEDLSGNNYRLLKNLASYKKVLNLASDVLDSYPRTLEAKIRVPSSVATSTRLGAIYGNYCTGEEPSFSFEIYSNGQPRLYFWDGKYQWNVGSSVVDVKWDVNVMTYFSAITDKNRWMDLAVTIDAENLQAECFINGASLGTKSLRALPCEGAVHNRFGVGGDLRSEGLGVNSTYFKGELANVRVWSNTRTAAQIAADAVSVNDADPNLVAHYDQYAGLEDLSSRGADLRHTVRWLDSVRTPQDYSYSFAVVGDTQWIARNAPEKLHYIYDWILDNASAMNTKYVFSMGDMTNDDTDAEWTACKTQLTRLNGVIPYNVLRGNHDGSEKLNQYFASDAAYTSQFGGFYEDGKVEDSWCRFDVGDVHYLVLTLNYGPTDKELEWASSVVEQNPECRVIVVTHGYLFRDGTTLDANDHYPPSDATTDTDRPATQYEIELLPIRNNGEGIWNKLVKKYANIGLVLCGHDPYDRIIKSVNTGDNGNLVTQLLVDAQYVDNTSEGPTGMVTMLHFDSDGEFVQTETYSTIRGEYFLEDNQFDMTLEWRTDVVPPRYELSDFKTSSDPADWTYPEKAGKVFAGWYEDEALTVPCSPFVTEGKAYARFVDERVIEPHAQAALGSHTIRFVSTVDSLDYQAVGVRLTAGSKSAERSLKKVYRSITAGGAALSPSQASGTDESEYFTLFKLTNIPESDLDTPVTASAFWVTLDGTKVYSNTDLTVTYNSLI